MGAETCHLDLHVAERIDTHLSVVYVADDRVLKLRKAVKLTFVDQSTRAFRWAAAGRELARGRSFSPHLYVGIWGRDDEGRLVEDASPESHEPVLVMERAPADRSAALVLPTLDEPELAAFVDELVAVYERLPRVGPEEVIGNVRHALAANFAALKGEGLPCPGAELDAIHGRFDALRAGFEPMIAARAASGHGRHCHGDLRLDHVYLTTPLSFIDPLDFDARLCRTDVLTDIAFLVLGLRFEGYGAVAEQLAAKCLARWRQPEARGLLSFFVAYRALVRMKVAWIRSRQLDGDERWRALAEAEHYLGVLRRELDAATGSRVTS